MIPFILTLSWVLCIVVVTNLVDRKVSQVYKALEFIVKYYFQKGFRITGVTGDNEFEPL